MIEPLELTDEQKAEVKQRLFNDFIFFCRMMLKIRIKQELIDDQDVQQTMGAFILNEAQIFVLRIMFAQIKAGLPVRLVILKARQFGISTLFLAWIFWHMWRRRNVRAGASAFMKGTTLNAFAETMKRFYDNLPTDDPVFGNLKPAVRGKGAKASLSMEEAYFDAPHQSQCIYVAAKEENARGDSLDHWIATEVGDYEDGESFFGAFNSAMGERRDTTLVKESTAKPGYFRYSYLKAKKSKVEAAIFLPWTVVRSLYHKKLMRDTRGRGAECWRDAQTHELVEFDDFDFAEQAFLTQQSVRMGLPPVDLEQMYWRKWQIEEKFHGNLEFFNQEFPRDDKTCFEKNSGSAFTICLPYVRESVDACIEEDQTVIGTVEPDVGVKLDDPTRDSWPCIFIPERVEGLIDFERVPGLAVFRQPKRGYIYTLGSDVADDIATAADPNDANFSAMCVYCCNTREQVAEWRGSMDPEEFAWEIVKVGYFYNTAMAIVEYNNMGIATINELTRRLDYPNRFRWPVFDSGGAQVHKTKEMWVTTTHTKQLMISNFRSAVKKQLFKVLSPALQEEMIGYRTVNGNYRRGPDTQADRIISAALSWQAVEQTDYGLDKVLGFGQEAKTRKASGAAEEYVRGREPGRLVIPPPELPAELSDIEMQSVTDIWSQAAL